jgi:hypothetical protein
VLDGEIIKTTKAKRYVTAENREIILDQMAKDVELFSAIQSAFEREKNIKTASELLSTGTDISSHSQGGRQDYQSLGETQSLKLRDDEWRRFRERNLLDKFREFASIIGFKLEPFLEASKNVNFSKEHSKSFDWVPSFPLPSEYGYDLSKELSTFDNKYSSSKIIHLAGKKVELVVQPLKMAEQIIISRNWPQFKSDGDWSEIQNFIQSIARMGLLIIAYIVQSSKKNMDQEILQRDIANLYLAFSLLEKRKKGKIDPVEGIRLVKYS